MKTTKKKVKIKSKVVEQPSVKKVVINTCFGGFGLSHEAIVRYAELIGKKLTWKDGTTKDSPIPIFEYTYEMDGKYFYHGDIDRDDPYLVQVVEELGVKANGGFSDLKVVLVPTDVQWEISEYDGVEHIAEVHRTWY